MPRKSRLALTCGDPAGIGPEIIAGWVRSRPALLGDAVVIGPQWWLDAVCTGREAGAIAVGKPSFRATPGRPTVAGACVALEAMRVAAAGCRDGLWDAVVTGPVSKEWCARVDPGFIGQTEFFAEEWGGRPTMAFSGGRLRVVLATWHIPLAAVPGALTPAVITRAVRRAFGLCRAEGVRRPRVAVCGLNPHAGEGGLLGADEKRRINPLLAKLAREFRGLEPACVPGDTAFARALRGEFDAVVALYHDQGLAPLKAVDFDSAVNITLGLPWVRTSPDHGTALAIAGQRKADGTSLANAVNLAARLASTTVWRD
ncbi:MAG TPA: 4-hydroxythreonine-4-phosphate dehydrogenase PdxA [Opitutaceae bacterium]